MNVSNDKQHHGAGEFWTCAWFWFWVLGSLARVVMAVTTVIVDIH